MSTAAFSGHGGGPSAEMRAEIDPTKVLGAVGSRNASCVVPGAENRCSRRRRRGGVGWSVWVGKGCYEPTQADTPGWPLARGEATGADEVDADGVGTGKAVASGSVGFGGRLGESGKEVGVAVGRPSSVFEGVGVCGEELEPAPNAGDMLAYLGDALWSE